jgi:hypothetical protein
MKPSRTRWITNSWPLVDAMLGWTRCKEIVEGAGLPIPLKSACYFCPYHDNGYWDSMKKNYPEEFAKAVAFDAAVRDRSKRGMKAPIYLHRSLQPLDQVDFDKDKDQMDLFGNECEGICGV